MGSIALITTLEGQLSILGNRGHLPRWDGAGQGSLSPKEQAELVQRRTRTTGRLCADHTGLCFVCLPVRTLDLN